MSSERCCAGIDDHLKTCKGTVKKMFDENVKLTVEDIQTNL